MELLWKCSGNKLRMNPGSTHGTGNNVGHVACQYFLNDAASLLDMLDMLEGAYLP